MPHASLNSSFFPKISARRPPYRKRDGNHWSHIRSWNIHVAYPTPSSRYPTLSRGWLIVGPLKWHLDYTYHRMARALFSSQMSVADKTPALLALRFNPRLLRLMQLFAFPPKKLLECYPIETHLVSLMIILFFISLVPSPLSILLSLNLAIDFGHCAGQVIKIRNH